MNKDKMEKYLRYYIYLQPILDLITGILVHNNINLTIGIIVRLIFLGIIMYITVFKYKDKSALYLYIAMLGYSIAYYIGILVYKGGNNLFQEMQGLLKVIYYPILLYSIYVLKKEVNIKIDTLYKVLVMYVLLIFVPNILNIGYKTYEITKSGKLGYFNSANEVGGIISILTPILFIKLKEKKNLILQSLFLLIYLYTILNMGTKTPILSLIITLGIIALYLIIDSIKKKKYKLLISFISIVVVLTTSVIILLPRTNFYKNIKVHLDYLGVDNIGEIFTEFNLIDHFIFSQRLTFLSDENYIYERASTYEKIVGIGYYNNNEETKQIEMDYFDVYYHHGMLGFMLVFSTYGFVIYRLIKEREKRSFDRLMIYVSTFLILVLSLFSGHIIVAPSVNIIVVMILLLITKKIEIKEKTAR